MLPLPDPDSVGSVPMSNNWKTRWVEAERVDVSGITNLSRVGEPRAVQTAMRWRPISKALNQKER